MLGVFTFATMGFGVTGLGTEGTVIGAVIKLVSARVAAIFSTTGASGASLTTGAIKIGQIAVQVEAPIAQS